MRKTIKKYIEDLERQENIKVLLAVESGSRSWGFPSADSDYDVRLIYVHAPEWYYKVSDQKDTIVYMSDDRIFDLSGWELRKALRLMAKTDPSMTDWLFSDLVYKVDEDFLKDIQKLNDVYYNPIHAMHHYVSMARNLIGAVSDGNVSYKKYLYLLRAILNAEFILTFEKRPPVRFDTLLASLNIPTTIEHGIKSLITEKEMGKEHDLETVDNVLIKYAMQKYQEVIDKVATCHPTWSYPDDGLAPLDNLAIKYIGGFLS